jgi:hypothetical protein
MSFLPEDMDSFNADAARWAKGTKDAIVDQMNSLGIVHRDNSQSTVPAQQALKQSQRKNAGVVNKISFKFPRHMVFVAKGVGRGVPVSKAGQSNRKAKDWFNDPVEKRMDELTDIVADHHGAMVLNAILIK